MNSILARLLQAAAFFIGAKLLEALIKETDAMSKEVKKRQGNIVPKIMRLVQGGKK